MFDREQFVKDAVKLSKEIHGQELKPIIVKMKHAKAVKKYIAKINKAYKDAAKSHLKFNKKELI